MARIKQLNVETDRKILDTAFPLLAPYMSTTPPRYLEIDGKKVAYLPDRGVVAGVVVSDEYRTEEGVAVVDVNPIRRRGFKSRVLEALKGENHQIKFW